MGFQPDTPSASGFIPDPPAKPPPPPPEHYTITGSQSPANPNYPVGNELADFAANARMGIGKFFTDRYLGIKQRLGLASEEESAEKQKTDAPLQATAGGKVGQGLGAAPLAFLPGANTYLGSALLGESLGASQPTSGNESPLVNTALGLGLGVAAQKVGNTVGSWITKRAQEPFMGWTPGVASGAAANAVGSTAQKLDQDALRAAHDRFTDIFSRVRSPTVSIPVGDSTLNALESAGQGLNSSSRAALYANSDIKDLIAHLGSNPNAEQLGQISSRLGSEAWNQLTTKGADRALGRTLLQVQDHVDGLVGSSITDPALKATYEAALPQYRNFLMLRGRPALLNSSTGEVNATALGRYLQRADPRGYAEGVNTSSLYQAGRWGQATKQGGGAPHFSIENLGVPWAAYHAANNPLARALGGVASRAGTPFAPYLGRAGQGAITPARAPLAEALLSLRNPQQQQPP